MAQHCSVAILSTAISRMYWYEKLVQIYLTLISQNISSRKYFSVLNKSVVVYDLLVSSWLWLAHTVHFIHIWRIFCQYTNSPPKCPAHLVFIQNCSLVLSKFYEFINKSVWTKKIITTFSRLLCIGRRKWNPCIYPTFGIYWLRSTVYYFTLEIQARLPKSRKKLQSAILVAGYRYTPLAKMRSTWRTSFSGQIQGLWAQLGLKDARKLMEL